MGWPHGRGPFRAAVHGHDEGEQAGELHALDRWCLRGRPSRGSEEEQEVHPELCRRLHTLDPPLEGPDQVLRMLGSSKGLLPASHTRSDLAEPAHKVGPEGSVWFLPRLATIELPGERNNVLLIK